MKYKPSERLFCVICGKEITGAGNRLKKFCSYECQYEHIKNTRIKYRTCRTCVERPRQRSKSKSKLKDRFVS